MAKSNDNKKGKAGRPKKELTKGDWEKLEKMAKIQCTRDEMANIMGLHQETLVEKIQEHYNVEDFPTWYNKYASGGKMALRRMQFKTAEAGNAGMQIWLGKQYLGQKEQQLVEQQGSYNVSFIDVEKPEVE